ncbi:related to NOP7 - component of several different pre-ribosomal particles [Melanopsichium pennsylvanicum]|uniref:Pescadillo homolog n=3 Tax=Melanopsichium pennsylvanicum TaxID=63383 RepID=A0AAJ4XL30_9BASI|nr:related to NOP7 - component of several different pre-ribosomal particles [Melanopsichium pennsylvanicum]
MAKMKQKGKSGAAKNYITRNQAIKKLQVTLADFRRLCILKGIFPRQPKSVRKANKGSTAPTTFFFAKDIAFLQHEPVLQSLRDHKTFAKKLSRAIGRREWAAAKNLDESKPTYRLDHIIKERYPTFRDSLKDIDDALSLLTLFANLPATDSVSADVIATCSRLCAEWQLYVMKTKTLKKVFLSIKGIYFQAEVHGETITWLVPYLFTQHIPSDIDFRIMYTFLELYQTLLGFVLFKLYTDENLVYPPKFDAAKDEQAAGFGALTLDPASAAVLRGENATAAIAAGPSSSSTVVTASGKKVSAKDVKKQIKAISKSGTVADDAQEEQDVEELEPAAEAEDEFVEQPSKTMDEAESNAHLTTFDEIQAASTASEGAAHGLFTRYVFYISRECPRAVIEFVLRSFGALPGRIGWDMVAGVGSAVDEDDARITHHIIDRPVPKGGMKKYAGKRVFVQPQYIVDCANARKLLAAGAYGPGQTLPPHLSPFVDDAEVAARGGYVPEEAREKLGLEADANAVASDDDEDSDSGDDDSGDDDSDSDDEEDSDEKMTPSTTATRPALAALVADPTDASEAGLLDAAELEAEAAGGEDALEEMRSKHAAALKQAKKTKSSSSTSAARKTEEQEAKEMSKMMMSNRQRKLYEKLNYSSGKRAEETAKLQQKKKALNKKATKASLRK